MTFDTKTPRRSRDGNFPLIQASVKCQGLTPCGLLNIYKPSGITSYDVIRHIKKAIKATKAKQAIKTNNNFPYSRLSPLSPFSPLSPSLKIGHAGTLDPFAEGVLIVLLGKATKLAAQFLKCEKTYQGTIFLGARTDTGDITGKFIEEGDTGDKGEKGGEDQKLNLNYLRKVAEEFVGEIEQTPPMYSALHYQGKRLYELARKKITVERKPRKVFIYQFEILDFDFPRVIFRTKVSGGAYVRTLAEDFARRLNTAGFLECLTRTSVGNFSLSESMGLEDLNSLKDLQTHLFVPNELLAADII